MKAVVYHGPRNVSVDEVPDPTIEKPTDALVRITATNTAKVPNASPTAASSGTDLNGMAAKIGAGAIKAP